MMEGSRKIFVDLGAYDGDSIADFIEKHDKEHQFELYAFEPNPAYEEKLNHGGIVYYPWAAWTEDGEKDFYIGRHDGTGSTLMKNKASGDVDYKEPVTVKTFDVAQWIRDNVNYEDYCIVKMDIEGAEFEVIPKMIDSGAMLRVNELWVELHPNKIKDYTTTQANELRKRIQGLPGLKFVEWH